MLTMLNGLFWAFLRRWFGGFNPFKPDTLIYKVFDSRGLQTFVMVMTLFLTLFDRTNAWLALCLAVWIQLQFWSRAVGEILDCGRNTIQTAESYDRWFRVPLDWVYDRLGKVKYTGFYDWWYGWLRYGLPMIVPAVALGDWSFILIGLAGSPVYYGSWWLFDHFPGLYKLPSWCGEPKNLAEIVYGFVFGVFLAW